MPGWAPSAKPKLQTDADAGQGDSLIFPKSWANESWWHMPRSIKMHG